MRLLEKLFADRGKSYKNLAEDFYMNAHEEWFGVYSPMNANPHPFSLRPYEIEFDPLRVYVPDLDAIGVRRMVMAELLKAMQRFIVPSGEAFVYQAQYSPKPKKYIPGMPINILYYPGQIRETQSGEVDKSLRMRKSLGRFGAGIMEVDRDYRVVLFPPGYDHVWGFSEDSIYEPAVICGVEMTDLERTSALELLRKKGPFPKRTNTVLQREVDLDKILKENFPADPNPDRRFRYRKDGGYWESIPPKAS